MQEGAKTRLSAGMYNDQIPGGIGCRGSDIR